MNLHQSSPPKTRRGALEFLAGRRVIFTLEVEAQGEKEIVTTYKVHTGTLV